MLNLIPLQNVLFLDIETVPIVQCFDDLSTSMKSHWLKKTLYNRTSDITPKQFYEEKAGIYSEFSKIICISCGMAKKGNRFTLKSYACHEEKNILLEFAEMLRNNLKRIKILCAHNGKEFDFPFIARRMIINNIQIPSILQLAGKKPWQVPHLDTMELWKFGDRKNFTSIALLCDILGIPTPKSDIDGSQVADIYYNSNDLQKIVVYCEKDVLAVANIFRRYRNEDIFEL